MVAKDRIEDFVISMACSIKRAKKMLRLAGSDAERRAEAERELAESRKSFAQAIRMYREAGA